MNYDPKTDDAILEGLLYRADARSAAEDDPDEEEMFALFAEGRLQGEDRDAFLRYLDTHPQMRRAVRAYAKLSEAEALASVPAPCQPEMTPSHSTPSAPSWLAAGIERVKRLTTKLPTFTWPRMGQTVQRDSAGPGSLALPAYYRQIAFAMAAMLLVALTALLWFGGQPSNGPLTAFAFNFPHYDLDKGPGDRQLAIDTALAELDDKEAQRRLREGFSLVQSAATSPEKVHQAHNLFQGVIDSSDRVRSPSADRQRYYGWIGKGLTYFVMQEKFVEAADAFRQAIEIDSNSTDAQINLALALTQLAKNDEAVIDDALRAWKKIDTRRLADGDRMHVEREIAALEAIRESPGKTAT
jgi:hypothetical protein